LSTTSARKCRPGAAAGQGQATDRSVPTSQRRAWGGALAAKGDGRAFSGCKKDVAAAWLAGRGGALPAVRTMRWGRRPWGGRRSGGTPRPPPLRPVPTRSSTRFTRRVHLDRHAPPGTGTLRRRNAGGWEAARSQRAPPQRHQQRPPPPSLRHGVSSGAAARWPSPVIISGHPADGDGNAPPPPASAVAPLLGRRHGGRRHAPPARRLPP